MAATPPVPTVYPVFNVNRAEAGPAINLLGATFIDMPVAHLMETFTTLINNCHWADHDTIMVGANLTVPEATYCAGTISARDGARMVLRVQARPNSSLPTGLAGSSKSNGEGQGPRPGPSRRGRHPGRGRRGGARGGSNSHVDEETTTNGGATLLGAGLIPSPAPSPKSGKNHGVIRPAAGKDNTQSKGGAPGKGNAASAAQQGNERSSPCYSPDELIARLRQQSATRKAEHEAALAVLRTLYNEELTATIAAARAASTDPAVLARLDSIPVAEYVELELAARASRSTHEALQLRERDKAHSGPFSRAVTYLVKLAVTPPARPVAAAAADPPAVSVSEGSTTSSSTSALFSPVSPSPVTASPSGNSPYSSYTSAVPLPGPASSAAPAHGGPSAPEPEVPAVVPAAVPSFGSAPVPAPLVGGWGAVSAPVTPIYGQFPQ